MRGAYERSAADTASQFNSSHMGYLLFIVRGKLATYIVLDGTVPQVPRTISPAGNESIANFV